MASAVVTGLGLSPLDWVLFAALLILSTCIGIFYSIKDSGFGQRIANKFRSKTSPTSVDLNPENAKKNAKDEYLVGGRKMKVFPVAMSMMASFLSAILVIGTPAEIYQFGFEFWFLMGGFVFAIAFVCQCVLPVLYNLNVTSTYEYLEMRFQSPWPRRLGASLFILETLLYMGAAMFAPAVALEGVTGFDSYISMALLGIICTFYTAIGGIKAVMWTDVLQMLIMFIGLLAVLIKGSMLVGFSEIWEISRSGGRATFFDPSFDPRTRHSVWALLFGPFFMWMTKYGFNQSTVQRFSSLPTEKKAKITMYLNIPGVFLMHMMACVCGLVVYAVFAKCDLVSAGVIANDNQLMLYFVVKYLSSSPGMPGLFTAAIFAGALSTISSGLNSLAAIACEDVLGRRHFSRHSDQRQKLIMISLSAFFGVISVAMAFAAKNLGGNIVSIIFKFFSVTTGPAGGLFLAGLLFPMTEWIGAVTGCIVSLCFTTWLFLGQRLTKPSMAFQKLAVNTSGCNLIDIMVPTPSPTLLPITTATPTEHVYPLRDSLYSLSYLWWAMIANLLTLFLALIISNAIVRWRRYKQKNCGGTRTKEQLDPALLSPLTRWLCPKITQRWKATQTSVEFLDQSNCITPEKQNKKGIINIVCDYDSVTDDTDLTYVNDDKLA